MLQKAAQLCAEGVAFALVTVVRAVAPTSGKPGDKAILTEHGEWLGWVGGSCAEPAARRAARAALDDGQCRLLQLTGDGSEPPRPGVEQSSMTCYSGGSLELYVEPQLTSPSLVVCGVSPIALALGELGELMGYRVTRVDPGSDVFGELPKPGPGTFVVVASHGKGEDDALVWALAEPVGYVGLVTSRKRLEEVQSKLTARGLGAAELSRMRAPAGLDIGAKGPREVALSVLAQIVAERRGVASSGEKKAPRSELVSQNQPNRAEPSPLRAAPSCCDAEPAPSVSAGSCCDAEPKPPRAAARSCCDEEPMSSSAPNLTAVTAVKR